MVPEWIPFLLCNHLLIDKYYHLKTIFQRHCTVIVRFSWTGDIGIRQLIYKYHHWVFCVRNIFHSKISIKIKMT